MRRFNLYILIALLPVLLIGGTLGLSRLEVGQADDELKVKGKVPVEAPPGDYGVGWVFMSGNIIGTLVAPSVTLVDGGQICAQVRDDSLSILANGCAAAATGDLPADTIVSRRCLHRLCTRRVRHAG